MVKWSLQLIAASGVLAAAAGLPQLARLPAPRPSTGSLAVPSPLIQAGQRALVANSSGSDHLVALIDVDSATQRVTGIEVRRWRSPRRLRIALPPNTLVRDARFTSDSKHLVLEEVRPDGIHLSLIDPENGASRRLPTPPLSAAWGDPCDWDDNVRRVLCRAVAEPPGKGDEERGVVQLGLLDVETGRWQRVGVPGRYPLADAAPGGEFLAVGRADDGTASPKGTSAWQYAGFEVWTAKGTLVRRLPAPEGRAEIRSTGAEESASGAMLVRWDPSRPARLAWVGRRADRVAGDALYLIEPRAGEPKVLFQTSGRLGGISWSADGSLFATGTALPADGPLITWKFAGGSGDPQVVWEPPQTSRRWQGPLAERAKTGTSARRPCRSVT